MAGTGTWTSGVTAHDCPGVGHNLSCAGYVVGRNGFLFKETRLVSQTMQQGLRGKERLLKTGLQTL